MSVTAVIPAAGQGTRMGTKVRKPFLLLGGIPILVRTLRAFQNCDMVDEMVVVTEEENIQTVHTLLERYAITKPVRVTEGGTTRQQSVYHGILAASILADIIMVHDGVRPLVQNTDILRVLEHAKEKGAAVLGVPVTDTIKECDADGCACRTLVREGLWAVQTPQAFRKDWLLEAVEQALQDGFVGTDEASLLERMDRKVYMVPGRWDNIKMTTPADLKLGEFLLKEEGL